MLRTNEEAKARIRQRIEEIDRYAATHPLLFDKDIEDLWRERSILCKKMLAL